MMKLMLLVDRRERFDQKVRHALLREFEASQGRLESIDQDLVNPSYS